jgi:pimeloyl-ACP methyl ester carboxylesterase
MRGHRVSGGRQVRHSDGVILEFGRLATVSGRSLTYATVYRPPPDCTEAGEIPCRSVLDGLSGPFVLVGHSYSGVPVTEAAAAREDVTYVVYVCAFAVPAGTSMLDALGGQPREWWIFAEDGESIMPDYPGALLYGECTPAVANGAITRLRPHSARAVREPLRPAGNGKQPATYVISERDAILPADAAEGVAALVQATTLSLDSDHHPMLSRPAELALTLAGIVARTTHAEPATS